jgi:hypothetical protein
MIEQPEEPLIPANAGIQIKGLERSANGADDVLSAVAGALRSGSRHSPG